MAQASINLLELENSKQRQSGEKLLVILLLLLWEAELVLLSLDPVKQTRDYKDFVEDFGCSYLSHCLPESLELFVYLLGQSDQRVNEECRAL